MFLANGFHPMVKYAALVRHYRSRWEAHGHNPADAVVGAGLLGPLVADTSQQALRLTVLPRDRSSASRRKPDAPKPHSVHLRR